MSFHSKGGRQIGSRKGFLDVARWVPLTGKLVRAIWLRCGFSWHHAGEHWSAIAGESLMIAAALYAASTHRLDIFILVPLAAMGAICGDQLGYFVGRWIGYRLLARWGRKVGLSDERLELGRFLFRKYGAGVVFSWAFRRVPADLRGGARWGEPDAVAQFSAVERAGRDLLDGALWIWRLRVGRCGEADHWTAGDWTRCGGGVGVAGDCVLVHRNERRLIEDARREMRATPGG